MNKPIKTKIEGSILEVTIDRPKANAIDSKTSIILGDIFADFRDNPKLKVAIITGGGEKFFSAGWDLKAVNEGEAADADYGVGGFGGLQELPNMNKPIISAVNGIACGGGFEIMISADIIIAANHATFALPEINVGVIADAATIKLRRRIPYHVAVEFLMTGRWMDVKEAKHWGLVNEIVDKKDLLKRSWEIADKISKGKIAKFINDNSLLNQIWIMDPKKKVSDILKEHKIKNEIKVLDFVRYKVGEGI